MRLQQRLDQSRPWFPHLQVSKLVLMTSKISFMANLLGLKKKKKTSVLELNHLQLVTF